MKLLMNKCTRCENKVWQCSLVKCGYNGSSVDVTCSKLIAQAVEVHCASGGCRLLATSVWQAVFASLRPPSWGMCSCALIPLSPDLGGAHSDRRPLWDPRPSGRGPVCQLCLAVPWRLFLFCSLLVSPSLHLKDGQYLRCGFANSSAHQMSGNW